MKIKIYKPLTVLLVAATALSAVALPTSAEASYNWYIRRNGNETPGFPANAAEISSYNAYFVDYRCTEKSGEKKLYLTFDAGYENGNVERILDALKKENVPAAFFVLDNIILKNPDLVKRMTDEGHLVCNHTKRHKNLCNSTYEEIAADIGALEAIYKEKTGLDMAKYFRFPEGKYSITALSAVKELGYKTVFWSFAYDDWDNNRQPSAEKALKKILDNTHSGAVMLFHPTSRTNADIFPTLIKSWRDMGYTFGTLDELTS